MPRRKGSNRASSFKRGASALTPSPSSTEGKRTRASQNQPKREILVSKQRPGRRDHESSSTSSSNSTVSSPLRKSRGRGTAATSSRTASQSSSSRTTPLGSRASSSSSTTSTQRALNTQSAMKRTHSYSSASEPLAHQRRSPSPVNTTPAVEPVEQRWEESEGTYLHKKFKKMASAVQSVESTHAHASDAAKESIEKTTSSLNIPPSPPTTGTVPAVPIPTVIFDKPVLPNRLSITDPRFSTPSVGSQFPLKHSALSMLAPSALPVYTTPSTLSHSSNVYVPAPSSSPSKVVQQIPLVVTQQGIPRGLESSSPLPPSLQAPAIINPPVIRIQPQSSLLLQQSTNIQNTNSQSLHYSQQLSPPQRQPLSAQRINQPITLPSTNDVHAGVQGPSLNSSETHSLPHSDESKKSTKKRNECPFCQIVCAKPSVLDKHIRTHTNERPYPCEPCGFAFKTKSNLYKHKKSRTHKLKIEKGIDSHSEDIVAELGDGVLEERDQVALASQSSAPHPHSNFHHVVFTPTSTLNSQATGISSNQNINISNNVRIPTITTDSRLPLILTTQGHPSGLTAATQHQVPRFLTNPMEHLRPEHQFSSPSNIYTAKPGHLSSQPSIQGGASRFISQIDPQVYPRGPMHSQNFPRVSNQYTSPVITKQPTASHDMAMASHHRAIAVASLTQASSSASSLGLQRNNALLARPTTTMDPIRGTHVQQIQRPLMSSTELRSSQHPPLMVSGGLREHQQQATDLSKAIRSSAADAVAAVIQRAYPIPQAISNPTNLVKELQYQTHTAVNNKSNSSLSQEHPPHTITPFAPSSAPKASLPSGFTVSQIPNPKYQQHTIPNSIALSSSSNVSLASSPSLSLTTLSMPHTVLPNDNEPRDLSSKSSGQGKPLTLTTPTSFSSRMPLIQLPQQPLPNTLPQPASFHQSIYQHRPEVNFIQQPSRPLLPTAPLPIVSSTVSRATAPLILHSSSMPTDLSTTGSSCNNASPSKKVGSELRIPELQQRIDKVISENQAIVETLDPLWPRRYMRQSSKDKEKETSIGLTTAANLIGEDSRTQQPQITKNRYTSVVKYGPPAIPSTQSLPPGILSNPTTVVLNNLPSSISSIISTSHISNTMSKSLQLPQQPLPARQVVQSTIITEKGIIPQQPSSTIPPNNIPLTNITGSHMLPKLPDSVIQSMRQQEVSSPNIPLNLASGPTTVSPGRTRTFSLPSVIPALSTVPQSPNDGPQSVKEVWINSCKKPSKITAGHIAQLEDIASSIEAAGSPFHPENPEGSMIKELLLKTRMNAGISTSNSASTLTLTPSDSVPATSSFGSTTSFTSSKYPENQIVIEVQNKVVGGVSSIPPIPKPTTGNLSLIVSPVVPQNSVFTSSSTSSSLIPIPNTKLLSPLVHSDIHGASNITKWIHCPLCSHKFQGIDLAVHQQNHCPEGPNSLKTIPRILSTDPTIQPSTSIPSLMQVDIPFSNYAVNAKEETRLARIRRHSEDAISSQILDTSPPKQPKLITRAIEPPRSIYGRGGGGIISMTSNDHNQKLDSKGQGLLQIAQPALFSGGGVITTNDDKYSNENANKRCIYDLKNIVSQEAFNIPGIPTPQMSGILTGIKPSTSLFSLPGKPRAFEDLPSMNDSKSNNDTSTSTSLTIEPIKMEEEIKNNTSDVNDRHVVPFVPGIPGPYSQSSSVTDSPPTLEARPILGSTIKQPSVTSIQPTPSASTMCEIKVEVSEEDSTFLRPSSLPLTPGSFKPKKHVMLSQSTPGGPGATLISPETPRPKKCYALQYQNGTAYTYLGLKRSTRVYFCTLSRPQPVYVLNKPKLSMYSNWKVVSKDSHPSGLPPPIWLGCYNSTSHSTQNGTFTMANIGNKQSTNAPKYNQPDNMIMTHSSQWKKGPRNSQKSEADGKTMKSSLSPNRRGSSQAHSPSRQQLCSPRSTISSSGSENESTGAPDSIRRVEGGYKSSEDVKTYVRGRGRGRYVCDSCGIRCKKPSMLKKHAKTHSDMRPYTCRYCNFAFKTKGNLTKHMKSKAHHKKCVEIGISPIPISVEDLESRQGTGEGPSTQQDGHQSHGILMAGDDSDNELEIDENESGDDDDGQFEDADEDSEMTGQDSDGTQSPLKQTYHRSENSSMYIQMKALGLMPSRPQISTFPYIPTEIPELSTVVSINPTITKSDSVAILPIRPQIHVDLAPSTISDEFGVKAYADRSVPLLAQLQSGSQERYYFSSTVTTTSDTVTQQSVGGEAKLAADVIALSSFTPPTLNATLPVNSISSRDIATVITTASLTTQAISSTISISTKPSSLSPPVSDRHPIDPIAGSVTIFKTFSPPNQSVGNIRIDSPDSAKQISMKEQRRDILSPVSESTMSYYLDKASVLTARSQQLLQGSSRRDINHSALAGNPHDQLHEHPPASLQMYLQERAVMQAARANNHVGIKDDKPPDNVVAPNNSYQRSNLNKDRSVNNNLEATCQAIMAQSNSTMQVPPGGVVVVLDKKSPKNTTTITSAPPSNITLAPLDSLQKPRESATNVMKANSPTQSANAMFKQDITYAPRNVTMNVNDMPLITSSSSIVHHHPQLPQNVQLAANAATASTAASLNMSYPTLSNSKSPLHNGLLSQTPCSKKPSLNQDQNSNIQVQQNSDGSSPAKRIKSEAYHNNQSTTPTKSYETGVNDANRINETTISSPTAGLESNNASNIDSGRVAHEFTEICTVNEDGKPTCGFCHKVFPKQSQLRLHVNIHYFERPFRCDACAVSFRTKGHLQKHKRSTGHFNKVNINATFGTPSNANPRPFKCTDCKVAFRIHGHLAKHLRSKMHIMKLECSGKLPIGMFAEMERLGTNLNEIDTKDCDRSLESLQEIAVKLYNNDPSKLTNTEDVQNVPTSHSDASDNEDGNDIEVKEEPLDPQTPTISGIKSQEYHNSIPQMTLPQRQQQYDSSKANIESRYTHHEATRHNPLPNDHYQPPTANHLSRASTSHGNQQPNTQSNYLQANHLSQSVSLVPPPNQQIGPRNPSNAVSVHMVSPYATTPPMSHHPRIRPLPPSSSNSNIPMNSQSPSFNSSIAPTQVVDQPRSASVSSSHLSQDDASATDSEPEGISTRQPQTCQQCSKTFSDMKSLQIHIFIDHHSHSKGPIPTHRNISPETTAVASPPVVPNNMQNPFPSFNVQHQTPNLHQSTSTHQSTSSTTINEPNHRPPSRGGASSSNSSIASEAEQMFTCDLCGMAGILNRQAYKEHLRSHASGMPLRPFVCQRCDAGFTSQNKLDSHMALHQAA